MKVKSMAIFDQKSKLPHFNVGQTFSPLERVALAAQHAEKLFLNPNLIRKAPGTCGPAAFQRLLASGLFAHSRIDFLQTVISLAYSGTAVINTITIDLPVACLAPQPSQIEWHADSGKQDYASYLFQMGLVAYLGQRWTPKMRFLPGSGAVPNQWQLEEAAGKFSLPGTLINFDEPGNTAFVDRTGGLTPPQLSGLACELLGLEQLALNAFSYSYAGAATGNFPKQDDDGLSYMRCVEDLPQLLQKPKIANLVLEVLFQKDETTLPTGILPNIFMLVAISETDPNKVDIFDSSQITGGLKTISVERLFQALTGTP